MPYKIDLVNGHLDLIAAIAQFSLGWPDHGGITPTITGNGDLRYVRALASTAPLETWTIVCTTGGGDGVAIFSVTGSTSGAKANATAGTQYNNGIISFKITGPALYNCVVGDQWVFTFAAGPMAAASKSWVLDRYTGAFTSNAELIMHGIGGGTETIYVGYKSYEIVGSDIYNVALQGYTGYLAGEVWQEQPGAIPEKGWNGVASNADMMPPQIGYAKEPSEARLFLTGSTRCIRGCIFFEGYSAPFYTGLMLPYMTPNQWAYPLVVGGSMGGDSDGPLRYSNTNVRNSSWFSPLVADNTYLYQSNQQSSLRVFDPSANWMGLRNYYTRSFPDGNPGAVNDGYPGHTWPYAARYFEDIQKNIDGSYPLFPLYFISHQEIPDTNTDSYIMGAPEGCFAISGFDNNQENTFSIGSDLYVVVRNSQYSSVWDYMAMRLDA